MTNFDASDYSSRYDAQCAPQPEAADERSAVKEFLVSPLGRVALYVLVYAAIYFLAQFHVGDAIIGPPIVIAVCSYFGWKSLTRIQPAMFVTMPLAGWMWYFIVKFLLSIVAGVIVTPYFISKHIAESM